MKEKKPENDTAVSAFFTIEAGVVIPIVFVLLISVICLTFYVHDSVAVRAVCMETAVKNAEKVKKDKTPETEGLSQDLAGRMLIMQDAQVALEAGKDNLTVNAGAAAQYPTAMIRGLLEQSAKDAAYRIRLDHLDARKEIVGYKVLSEGLSTMDAGD